MKVQALLLLLVAGCAARPAPARPAAPHRAPAAAAPKPVAAPEPVAVVAPAPEAPPPPSGDAEFVPTAADQVFAQRVIAFVDEMAAVMDRHKDDCGRMVDDLELLVQRNQDLLLIGKQMKDNPPRLRWLEKQVESRLQAAMPRFMAGFQTCQNDARMMALFRKLGS